MSHEVIAMGAAGRLGVLLSFFSPFSVLFDDGVGWLGMLTLIYVHDHVTLMMLL